MFTCVCQPATAFLCNMAGSMTMVMVLSSSTDDALLEPRKVYSKKLEAKESLGADASSPLTIPGHHLPSGLRKFMNQNEPWKVHGLCGCILDPEVGCAKRPFFLASVAEKCEKVELPRKVYTKKLKAAAQKSLGADGADASSEPEPLTIILGHNLQSDTMKFMNQNEPWKVRGLCGSVLDPEVRRAKRRFILASVVEKFEKAMVELPESLASLVHDALDDKLCDLMSKRTWETRIQNARQQAHKLCD